MTTTETPETEPATSDVAADPAAADPPGPSIADGLAALSPPPKGHVGDERVDAAMAEWKDVAGDAAMEVYRPTLMPSVSAWAHITRMADDLSRAVALPQALRGKPADIALVLLVGRDVGVGPTTALNKIYVIDGKPSMAPELMRALMIDRGHDVWFEDVTAISVTICAHRANWPVERVSRITWTLDDARRAGLIEDYDPTTGAVTARRDGKKDVWRKYPRSMLKARATSELGRDDFPDVLLGVSYVPEELDADVDADGALIRVESTAWSENSPNAPVYQPAPDIVIAAFVAEIDKMTPEMKEAVAAKWKELNLRRLTPPGPDSKIPEGSRGRQLLAVDEIDLAAAAIEGVKRAAPVEAEVIEGATVEPAASDDATPVPVEKAEAFVADLSPSQVLEMLETFEENGIPTAEGDQRAHLVELLAARVLCAKCGALRDGPAIKDEVHCGCETA